METALSTISILPSGKAEVERFKSTLKSEILAGNDDPLKVFVRLKYIEKTIADTLKDEDIERHILKEFDLYGKEKIVEVMGAKLNAQETGVKYFYEDCGDPVWSDYDAQIKDLTEKRKAREKFLQALPKEGTVDPSTGVYINRPPKSSTSKVICKFF
jgi:hypothetical protein